MRAAVDGAPRRRSGMAIVAALGLMLLAAGLLAAAAVASRGLGEAARTARAAARADSELRRGLAATLQEWQPALDSVTIGGTRDRTAPPLVLDGVPLQVRTRVRRLGPALYANTVTVRVGDSLAPLVLRRARLLVARKIDTTAGVVSASPRPLSQWSVSDLP